MFLWHHALEGDDVLDEQAKKQLFEPRVPEEPGGDTYAAYGWVVFESEHGRVLWHNGGNGWSYGELARLPDSGAMVFWVTNQSRSTGDWNLERSGSQITEAVLKRLVAAAPVVCTPCTSGVRSTTCRPTSAAPSSPSATSTASTAATGP